MSDINDKQRENVISSFELILTNACAEAEIAGLMGARGFPKERVEEGLALVRAARTAHHARKAEMGTQLQAMVAFNQAFAAANKAYIDFREVARAHFQSSKVSPTVWQALDLDAKVPQDTLGFISAAYATFDNALAHSTIVAALAPYGYTAEKISEARAFVSVAEKASQFQERVRGVTLHAAVDQEQAYLAIKAWMNAFKRVARRTLQGRADLLARLGM